MVDTARLGLPLLEADQAYKHITHNEALTRIDALIQLCVESLDETVPPGAPAEGEMFGIGSSPTGAWAGHDGDLAIWNEAGWRFVTPNDGWLIWNRQEEALCVHFSGNWIPYPINSESLQNLAMTGVNATADVTNRLAVSSDAVLLTHDPAGSGDMRIKLNKSAATDTASQMFQQDYSGYAECGLTGDNNFHIKVSPDNFLSSFEGLRIENDTGLVVAEQGLSVGHSGTPISALHVVGETGSGATAVTIDGDGGPVDEPLRVRNPSETNVLVVRGDGDVENVNNSYGAISDLRLKQDIDAAGSQWNDIKQIQLRKYRLQGEVSRNVAAPFQLGVIAQEVAEISPGLISEGADGRLGIKYSILYLKALGALQEAMARIERLEELVGQTCNSAGDRTPSDARG